MYPVFRIAQMTRPAPGNNRQELSDDTQRDLVGPLGTEIEAELTSPSGDPVAYRIRGATIALRREQAELIRVERLPSEA